MNINMFKQSPEVAPLLVRLYDSHKLYSLAQDKQPLAKAELTSAVAELLEVDLSPHEQELLTDVLIALMRQAEKELRAALSDRLSAIDSVPLRLVLHLANDDIEIARPVLRNSTVLSDLDLIYIIKSQGTEYWQAIADRDALSSQVIDILADTQDLDTAIVLSKNDRVRLTEHAINILGTMSQDDEAIAKPLLMRPEIPQKLAANLYEYVGEELKSYIRSTYDIDEDLSHVIDEVVLDFVEPKVSEYWPTEPMIDAADKYAMLNMLNLQVMIEALQRGQIPQFIAMFSKYTGLSIRRVHDFLKQPCPKGFAIACRAFGVQKGDFSRIYLMTNKMRSKRRVINQADMLETLNYFDKVRPEVALKIVQRSTVH